MNNARRLRTKRDKRQFGKLVADAVGIDWLNGRPSKARARMIRLVQLLKEGDLLSKSLRKKRLTMPSLTPEAQELYKTLDKVYEILKQYPGTRTILTQDDFSLQEAFGLDSERLQNDDEYYSQTRVMNFALELLRDG